MGMTSRLVLALAGCALFCPQARGGAAGPNLCVAVNGTTISADSWKASGSEWRRLRAESADVAGGVVDGDRVAFWSLEGREAGLRSVRRVIDGDRKTYWIAGRRRTKLIVTFPRPVTVSRSFWFHAECPPGETDERGLKDYVIETSLDGKRWQLAASVRDYRGGMKHDAFAPREAKYVKLQILATQGFLLPVLCEWELYEKAGPVPAGGENRRTKASGKEPSKPLRLSAEVTSDKLLYRPGEDARIAVKIFNPLGRDRKLRVVLSRRRGVDPPSKLMERDVTVRKGTSEVASYTLRGISSEYGHFIRARIFEDGKEISAADCVFEMADDWAKIARFVNDDCSEKFDPDFPREEITDVHIPLWRKLYVNCVEFQGNYLYYGRHYTEEEEWNFPAPYRLNNAMSARTIKAWTEAGRRNGIRVITYSETGCLSPELEFDKKHPRWILYGPVVFPKETASLHALWMYFGKRLERVFPAGKPIVAPDMHAFDYGDMRAMTEYLAEDIAAAAARFGWEGAFFDSFPWALDASAYACDGNGKRINTASPGGIGYRFLKRLREEVRKRTGRDFFVFANFGVPQGLTPWHEKNPDLEEFRRNRAIYRKVAGQVGAFILEQHPAPSIFHSKDPLGRFRYPQTIEDTVRALRLIREANDVDVPVMLLPLQYGRGLNRSAVDAKLLYSCCYASGVLIDIPRGTFPRKVLSEPLSTYPYLAVEANMNKFAARYGQYLFDPSIRWLAAGRVHCKVPETVWWKELVSFRDREDGGREIYVHLINRPAVPLTWGRKVAAPKPLADIPVTLPPRMGGKVLKGVWCISPDGDHNPVELKFEMRAGGAAVTVPHLEYWTMLLGRYER